jgi:hypothetical protein
MKPELSRTYFEIGKRLSEPNSPYQELNGISAAEYLNKAKTMFYGDGPPVGSGSTGESYRRTSFKKRDYKR